jgi:hypothetical protein
MRTIMTLRSFSTLMLLLVLAAGAGADGGTNAGLVLRMGSGARIPAMGDAGVANSWGVAALHYNPAGLGVTERAEVGAMYQSFVLDIGQGELRFAHPINNRSAWGVSLSYLDYGLTTRVTLADIFQDVQPATKFTGHDLVLGASYGLRVTDQVSIGATGKLINGEIDNTSATAFAADFGLLARAPGWPVRFGVSVLNLGSSMKYDRTKNDLPLLVRGGLAVDLFENRLTIAADLEKVRNQGVSASVGAEVRLMELLALRVGYDGRIDADNGLTAGLGVKVADFAVDYAYVPFGRLGNSHRLGLTYQFGPRY